MEVFRTWSKWLKREHRERPDLVHEEALALLSALGLIERGECGALRVHAAAARYAPQADVRDAGDQPSSLPPLRAREDPQSATLEEEGQ